jgi:hypothetical protein
MRTFLRAHWKALVAIVLLVVLALFTVNPGAAVPDISLAERLRSHVAAIASGEHNTATPAQLEEAARYIEGVLGTEGYAIRRQEYEAGGHKVRNIEVSVSNVSPNTKPARIFIVGANRSDNTGGSGTAAVLELARLLKDMRPSPGTEVKFVFFVNDEPPYFMGQDMGSMQHARKLPPGLEGRYPDTGRPDAGNFIAFVGTMESARLVQDALSAFRAVSDFPAHGLAAPAYVQGVTLSDHSSYKRFGYPAIMITDTGFLRYPYYQMSANDSAEDTPDKLDYESTARVVRGLARTITALAAGAQG